MNDQHKSIRRLLASLLKGLALVTIAGCGSADVDAPSPDLPGAVPDASVSDLEDWRVGETNATGETLCGKSDLGIELEGLRMVELEAYSFEGINRRLSAFPEIAEFVGFDQVSDCEGARAAVQGYNDYVEAHPDFLAGPTKQEMFGELLSNPENVGAPANDEDIEKILGGTETNRSGVVQLVRKLSPTEGYFCTGVRIAGPLFLTAAHCLRRSTGGVFQQDQHLIKRKRTSGAEGWVGGVNGKWLKTYAVGHPNFVGGEDRDYDVAVVYVFPENHSLLHSDPEFNTVRLIATQSPFAGQLNDLYGWGRSNDTEEAKNFRQRWPGDAVPIGGATTQHFWIISDGPTLSVCLGDSGGPAIRSGLVNGILADVKPQLTSSKTCALPGELQYWGRLDYKIQWLKEAMYNLQKGQTKKPYYCKFHSGNPSDEHDVEHLLSNMNCNERLP